jgi:hypothetical protein
MQLISALLLLRSSAVEYNSIGGWYTCWRKRERAWPGWHLRCLAGPVAFSSRRIALKAVRIFDGTLGDVLRKGVP